MSTYTKKLSVVTEEGQRSSEDEEPMRAPRNARTGTVRFREEKDDTHGKRACAAVFHRSRDSPKECHTPLPSSPDASTHSVGVSTDQKDTTFLAPFSRERLSECIGTYLTARMDNANRFPSPSPKHRLSVFCSIEAPRVTIEAFVKRLISYTHCSPSAFIVMLLYVDRFMERAAPTLRLTELTVHRVVMSSLMAAVKMLDDRVYSTGHYARVGGVPSTTEMRRMEVTFIQVADYRLLVDNAMYERMKRKVLGMPLWKQQRDNMTLRAAPRDAEDIGAVTDNEDGNGATPATPVTRPGPSPHHSEHAARRGLIGSESGYDAEDGSSLTDSDGSQLSSTSSYERGG